MSASHTNLTLKINPEGTVDFRADQSMGGHNLTNLADPVSAQDAATKAYALALAGGLSPKAGVVTATGGALPITFGAWVYNNAAAGVGATLTAGGAGALVAQSGHTMLLNERLLIKNQAAGLQNGLYKYTTVGASGVVAVFTRATDCDTADKNISGTSCYVNGSDSTLQASQWILTTAPAIMGADTLVFTQGDAGLSQTSPLDVRATAVVGTEYAGAHGDHAHAHGAQTGGTMHAAAIAAGASGFLTGADKTKLDATSGSNTGDQTITLTGDVTGSGGGSFAATIAAGAVTAAKLAADSIALFATAAQGTLATNALPKAGGTMSGAIAMGAQSITGANVVAAATATLTGKVTNYNSLVTVEGGVPSAVKSDSKSAQTANLGATTIYASAPAGRYRISVVGTITAFGTTATIPRINVIFTHGGVVKTIMISQSLASFSTANGTSGSGLINVDAATNIQYSTGGTGGDYASTGTAMQYDLYIVLEAV